MSRLVYSSRIYAERSTTEKTITVVREPNPEYHVFSCEIELRTIFRSYSVVDELTVLWLTRRIDFDCSSKEACG